MSVHPRAPTVALAVILTLLLAPMLVASPTPRVPQPPSASPPGVSGAWAAAPQPLAANFSLGLTASTAQADPKDTVVFTVYFNNTGTQSAPAAWINITDPFGYTFIGDNAAGNVSGYPTYEFTNLALGLHSFRMTFLVDVGTTPGTRLYLWATLVYADGTGGQHFLGPASASVLVGVVAKQLYLGWGTSPATILTPVTPTGSLSPLGTFTFTPGGPPMSFDLSPPLARSFRALNASAVLYFQGLVSSMSLDVNLTLIDVNGGVTTVVASVERAYTVTGSGYWTLYYTFPSMNYQFSAGHAVRLQVLSTTASGGGALLATNASLEPSRINFQTTTYVSVDSLQPASFPTTYLSPKSTLVITANVSDPFGSAEVLAAHVNVTGPSGPLTTWATPFPVVAVDLSRPSAWKVFQISLPPLLANGSYAIEVTAVEGNGVVDYADTGAVVRAPAFTLVKVASPTQGKSGTKITYSIWYNDTGSGPAGRVWLNDTLPSQVTFSSATPAQTSSSGTTYYWVFTSGSAVSVGSHLVTITVQVKGVSGVSYIRNWATLNYTDPQGFLWLPLRSHADVVLNGPYLSLTQTSVPAGGIHSNQTAVVSISLRNTGDASPSVWMNDTVPAGLTYVTDTAGTVGGSRTIVGNQVHWGFSNLPSGSSNPVYLNFTMTVTGAAGLPMGATLLNVIGLNETSTNGLLMPDQLSLLPLVVRSPMITAASVAFGVASAVPNVPLPVYVNVTNTGNEAAPTGWVNLSLGTSLRFLTASVGASVSGSTLHLLLTNASVGTDTVSLTVAAVPPVYDRQVLSLSGTLRVADGYGNWQPPFTLGTATVSVALPNVSFQMSPGRVTLEAGVPQTYVVAGGNSGSGTASVVWMNVTLPAGVAYVSDTFGVGPVILGNSYSWSWRNYAPGARSYALVLAADDAAADRTSATFTFTVQAFDEGGNPSVPTTFGGTMDFVAPAFTVSVRADAAQMDAGHTFTYTLLATNTGSTTAQTVWLTDPIDGHLSVIYYNGSVPATGTTTLNWTFQDVSPGQTIEITLLVRVADGTPPNTEITNTIQVRYTNSVGVALAAVRSLPVYVLVPPNFMGLLAILLGGLAFGGLAVFVVYRRYRVRIEDVFLIYRDGILVSHLTQGDGLEKDEDLLSGMLTAVQDFVKDAFTYGEHRELHQLEFGDRHVLIERGKVVYLAVVYQGRDSGLIRKKVRTVLDKVEATFGSVFDAWDGDMSRVQGTHELLKEGFVDTKHPWSLVVSKSP